MSLPPARLGQLRPRPEDFLTLLERGKRGRLKLYIGFAAGVGKTYRMLEEAHDLLARGIDVDAILARKPAVAVVDELAHTNLPVCRNRKRFQDVQELLNAGISVIGA